jgi:hypothetical protein
MQFKIDSWRLLSVLRASSCRLSVARRDVLHSVLDVAVHCR